MKSAMALVAAGTLVLSGFAGCERAEDANANRGGVPRNNQGGTGTPSTTGAGKTAPSTTTPGAGTGVTGNQSDLNTQMHQQAITAWKQQVQDLRGRVDLMKNKIDAYQGADKDQIQAQYHQLQTQVAALDTRVSDFKETGAGTFDSFRGDVESSMTRVNDQLRDLETKLNKPSDGISPTIPPSDVPSMPDSPKTPDTRPQQPPNPNDPG